MNMGIVAGLIKALAPGVDPEIIEQAVMDWLDDHPEATTTVQDGSITKASVLREIGGGCGKEALRVVNSMPKWKPGKQSGRSVRSEFTLPVQFELN